MLQSRDPSLQKRKRKVTKKVKNKGISKVVSGKYKQEVGAMNQISDKIEFRPKVLTQKTHYNVHIMYQISQQTPV